MQRSAAVSSSSELARLAGVLVRWTGASVSEIARAAQVDRGNLSRFLRQAKHSGIGVGRAPAVLSALGWSPLGPSPIHVHKWLLDDRVDLGWVFGTLLSGEVEVSALIPFESPHEKDQGPEHVGWLIGCRRNTYFLLSQRSDTPSPTRQDLLAELLDPRHRLAKPVEPVRVDVHAFHQITESELTPTGFVSALGRPAKPDLRLSVQEGITPSSGNVFIDMGLKPEEAAVLALRADLMGRLRLMVRDNGWTQVQAAEHFGIAQSRVSDLLRGKWEKFSLDMLITLAARAGRRIELVMA